MIKSVQSEQVQYHQSLNAPPNKLAEICLLLSYWGPYSWEVEINEYWADLALEHSFAAVDAAMNRDANNSRYHLLTQCCIIRRRMLALYTGCSSLVSPSSLTRSFDTQTLSGTIEFPTYVWTQSRDRTRSAFIMAWRLTEIMAQVLSLRDEKDVPFSYARVVAIRGAIHAWDNDYATPLKSAYCTSDTEINLVFNMLSLLKK